MLNNYNNFKLENVHFIHNISRQSLEPLWRKYLGKMSHEKDFPGTINFNIFEEYIGDKVWDLFIAKLSNDRFTEELPGTEPEQLIHIANKYRSNNEISRFSQQEIRASRKMHTQHS